MSFNAFNVQGDEPSSSAVARAVGPAAALWDELRQAIRAQFPPLAEEWVYGGKNHGWSLRLKQKKRAVLYLTPSDGFFRASFAFGESAVHAAQASNLPDWLLKLIEEAPKYVEGRAVRLEVRTATDVQLAVALAQIKMGS